MFDFLRSDQSNERNAMAQNMNPLMRDRMMKLLRSMLPEESTPPATFDDAIGGGHFDDPKLTQMLEILRRRHASESMDRAGVSAQGFM